MKSYSAVRFVKIDVDELLALANEVDIQAMPTVALFRDGKEAARVMEPDPNNLIKLIEKGLWAVFAPSEEPGGFAGIAMVAKVAYYLSIS
jgi:thioredoxin-like negative regulator of GroEL